MTEGEVDRLGGVPRFPGAFRDEPSESHITLHESVEHIEGDTTKVFVEET